MQEKFPSSTCFMGGVTQCNQAQIRMYLMVTKKQVKSIQNVWLLVVYVETPLAYWKASFRCSLTYFKIFLRIQSQQSLYQFQVIFEMNDFSRLGRHKTISVALVSDSSGDLSAKNNKQRIKEFTNLSLKSNSIIEHILSHRNSRNPHAQSQTIFATQKDVFTAFQQKRERKSVRSNIKEDAQNPFFKAKLNNLTKQKSSKNSGGSQQFLDDPSTQFQLLNEKTTFRLIKKSSANEVLTDLQTKFI